MTTFCMSTQKWANFHLLYRLTPFVWKSINRNTLWGLLCLSVVAYHGGLPERLFKPFPFRNIYKGDNGLFSVP